MPIGAGLCVSRFLVMAPHRVRDKLLPDSRLMLLSSLQETWIPVPAQALDRRFAGVSDWCFAVSFGE
jgi:hypothetical protein